MLRLAVFAAVVTVTLGTYNGDPKTAGILRLEADVSPEGFQYVYETENGISAHETGALNAAPVGPDSQGPAISVKGGYSYTNADGTTVEINYIANENGYQPQGDVLPVAPNPPPIPAAIVRALEYIRAHPQSEEQLARGGVGPLGKPRGRR